MFYFDIHVYASNHMWCDLVEISLKSNSFLFELKYSEVPYILLKTPPESDYQWFQSYKHLKKSQNNLKTKAIHSFFWLYPTINVPDFRLIPLDRNTHSRYARSQLYST